MPVRTQYVSPTDTTILDIVLVFMWLSFFIPLDVKLVMLHHYLYFSIQLRNYILFRCSSYSWGTASPIQHYTYTSYYTTLT